jgi:hypothetical protein
MSYKLAWACLIALMFGMLLTAYAAHALKPWAGWVGFSIIVAVLIGVFLL